MLPQFQRFAQDGGGGSLNSSTSFSFLNAPGYYEDLLSSVETDRTFVVEGNTATTRPPSPSPLLFVSVPLPLTTQSNSRHCGTGAVEIAGLVRSPARASGQTDASGLTAKASPNPASTKETDVGWYAELSSDASASATDTDDDDDSSVQFECTTISNTSSANDVSEVTASVSRLSEWNVVWMHIFPQHIAGFLTVRDVTAVSLVCRTACEAVLQPWVWRTLAVCHYAVQPGSVERVFCTAAHAWSRDEGTKREGHECGRRSPRLLMSEQRVMDDAAQFRESVEEEEETEEGRALTMSAATTPWLVADHTEPLDAEDAVAIDEEDDNTDDDDDDSAVEFNSTQPLQTTREDVDESVEADAAEDPLAESILRDTTTTTAAAAAAVARIATRAALTAGSRYLWQTTAAAMPSPSSPLPSPRPGDVDAEAEDDSTETSPVPNPLPPLPYPLVLPADAVPCRFGSSASAPPSCTPPIASARPSAPGPIPTSPSLPTYAAVAGRPVSARDPKNSSHSSSSGGSGSGRDGEKCVIASGGRAALRELLPPPSPAQLNYTVGSNDDGNVEDSGSVPLPPPSATTALPTAHRHPSCVLERATDVTVTSADGAASPLPVQAMLLLLPYEGRPLVDTTTIPTLTASSPSSVSLSPAPVPMRRYTLCRATAERTLLRTRPAFPWRLFTRFLYSHRVQASLSRYVDLTERARAELCRGAWEDAYGNLTHVIHALFQQGSCHSVEHIRLLAETLVRRASLCRHRGHLHLSAALTDLCAATALAPDCVAASDVAELCARALRTTLTPAEWMRHYADAAAVASPVALLGTVAQVPFLFPQHRTMCFCSALAAYMQAYRIFGQPLTHLLCRAAECATPGSEEELLVRALREAAQATRCPPRAAGRLVRRACATVDYAVSLMPLDVRRAADTLAGSWVRDCFTSEAAVYNAAMTQWAARSPDAIAFARNTTFGTRWLAWLTFEVQSFVYKELTDKLPSAAAVTSVVLALTEHDRADGLVRIAAQYANDEVRTENLRPPLPHHANRRRVTQYLLHNALHLRPLHPTAALLLSRVYAAAEAEEEAEETETERVASMSSAVLTDCIHRWARRFSLLELDGGFSGAQRTAAVYLHRRERSPAVCFVPSELLVGRNRCLHMVADLAEATEQHPSLSYPYQMRAAMAMDRGYHLAAVLEIGRVMRLSLDASDVALRVRFLRDAAAMPSPPRTPRRATEESAVVSRSASFENALLPYDTGAAALPSSLSASSTSPPHSPSVENSLLLRPTYRAWLARMSGLLTLLRPPECFARTDGEDDGAEDTGFAGSLSPGQSCSRVFARELPSFTTREYGSGHVSRVASLAFSEAEGESTFSSGDSIDACHVRAFLDDLVSTAGAAPAIAH